MNIEDELIREATETVEWESTPMIDRPIFVHGYVVGAHRNDDKLSEAMNLIKNIIRVTWGEGWNYSLDWKVKAEEFLGESYEKV